MFGCVSEEISSKCRKIEAQVEKFAAEVERKEIQI